MKTKLLSCMRSWPSFGPAAGLLFLRDPLSGGEVRITRCIGGGATAQIRLSDSWDAVIDLGGCNLLGLPRNSSGDSLTYLAGVRWSTRSAKRLAPDFRIMIGGHKVYAEITDPDRKAALLDKGEQGSYYRNIYLDYTSSTSTNGLALSIGGGVQLGLNRAVGLRLASIDYLYSRIDPINGYRFDRGLSLSTGLIINVGCW